MKQMTIKDFFIKFPNDDVCLQHIMELRYGTKGIICPSCNMKTNFYRTKSLRAYTCQRCGYHLYPCVGTPFQESRTSLQFWFYAMYLFSQTRSGVSAKELQRQLGVTYKCAWRMGHKIREYMMRLEDNHPLKGTVEVDEAYIGGKRPGKRGRGAAGKTTVMGMVERNGKIKTETLNNLTSHTISMHIQCKVEKGTHIHTDEFKSYQSLSKIGFKHSKCNHSTKQFVINDSHTNTIEGFWSRFKASILGTHVHISQKHLENYLAEFRYRYNSRHNPDQIFDCLITDF